MRGIEEKLNKTNKVNVHDISNINIIQGSNDQINQKKIITKNSNDKSKLKSYKKIIIIILISIIFLCLVCLLIFKLFLKKKKKKKKNQIIHVKKILQY